MTISFGGTIRGLVMLDKMTKAIQIAAALAVVLAAVFNIGFFVRVGYQFLGLIDVNSMVYTFGHAFLTVVAFALLLGGLYVDFGRHPARAKWWSAVAQWVIWGGFALAVGMVLVSLFVPNRYLPEFITTVHPEAWIAVWCCVLALVCGIVALSYYVEFGRIHVSGVSMCCLAVVGATFSYGSLFAIWDVSGHSPYEVTFKDGKTHVLSLVRATSSGLLVSPDGKFVEFVPMGQVLKIKDTWGVEPLSE
jgi:hypothetical protein